MDISNSIWLAVATLVAVAAAYLYTSLVSYGPVTPPVHPSLFVGVAAVALAAFTVKQALDSRSNVGGRRIEGTAAPVGGAGGSNPQSEAERSAGARELVDETESSFGVTDDISRGVEGDDGFRVVGSEFDDLLSTSVDYEAEDERRNQARQQVVDELREAAAYSVSRRMEIALEDAEDSVLSGDWTDAPRAAALLSDGTGPELPWRYRLLDLLAGRDVFLSSVDESVEAIASEERYR